MTTVTKVVVNFYEMPITRTSRASPCEDGYVYIPIAFVVMLYLVYLVECWHSHTRIELQYKVDINTVYDCIQSMREALPVVWWKAVCYHYVRRTRQVTRYRNGDAFTTTQVYYERVNSHTSSYAFNFSSCGIKDISKKLVCLDHYPATKIKFSKGFSFATVEAENEFEDQRAQFFQEHERRDDYMETREGLDLLNVNFKEYMIAFADPDNLPWYVSHIVFWFASVLLLSWPLRVLIEFKTAYVHYHVHKLFGSNYLDPYFCPGQMSRVSTMGSSELEMNISNNYTLVPSYSEALLMDSSCPNNQTQVCNGSVAPRSLSSGFLQLLGGQGPQGQLNGHVIHIANGHVQNGHVQNGHVPNGHVIVNNHAQNGFIANGRVHRSRDLHQEGGSSSQQRRRRRKKTKRRHHSQPDLAHVHSDVEMVPKPNMRRSRTPNTLASTPESPEDYDDPCESGTMSRDISVECPVAIIHAEDEPCPPIVPPVPPVPPAPPAPSPPEEPPTYDLALTMCVPPDVASVHTGSETEMPETVARPADTTYTLGCMETSL